MTLGQKATEPCPFCGSTDILSLMYPMAGWLARCDNCNAQIDGKYWNTRTDAALPAQVTDEMVERAMAEAFRQDDQISGKYTFERYKEGNPSSYASHKQQRALLLTAALSSTKEPTQ